MANFLFTLDQMRHSGPQAVAKAAWNATDFGPVIADIVGDASPEALSKSLKGVMESWQSWAHGDPIDVAELRDRTSQLRGTLANLWGGLLADLNDLNAANPGSLVSVPSADGHAVQVRRVWP